MRRLLIMFLAFLLFIGVAYADYYVPENKDVRLLLLYNNNRNNYAILYHIEFFTEQDIKCHISQFDLPIVVPPKTTIELPIICKFPAGDHEIRLKLYFLVNNSYPADEIKFKVHSGKLNYYVTVNGYFVNTTSPTFYYVHIGDIIKIIYKGNKFLGQSPIHLQILTYGIDKDTAYIILRAISEGLDSIYLPDLTHISFYVKGMKTTYSLFTQYETLKSIYEKIVEENEKLIKLLDSLNHTKDIDQIREMIRVYSDNVNNRIVELVNEYKTLNNFLQNEYKKAKRELEWYKSQYEIITNKLKQQQEEIEEKLLVKINKLESKVSELNEELNSTKFTNFVLSIALVSVIIASVVIIVILLFTNRKLKQKVNELRKEVEELKQSPIDKLISSEKLWKSEKEKPEKSR